MEAPLLIALNNGSQGFRCFRAVFVPDSPAKMDRRTIEERVLSADPSNNNTPEKVNTKVVFAVPNTLIAKILNNYEFDANVFSVVNTSFSIFVYDTLKVSPEKRKAIFSVKKILENTPIEFSELASNYLPPIIVSNTWSQEEIRKSTQTQIINFFKKYPALFFMIDEKTKAFLESEQGLDKIIGIKESNETIIKY
jgi:hypothetical protein